MARYSHFLGRKVEVQYRAGDIVLPASGLFVADSGRSIFLEQNLELRGQNKHFRWEIPYHYLVKIEELPGLPANAPATGENEKPAETVDAIPPVEEAKARNAASAAAGAGLLTLPGRPKPA
jgi:hypothetical protein